MIRNRLIRSNYAKNVFTLITGTVFAQAIPIAITPILTRIYSPADFGVFAFFAAICAILTVVVTGRYELAIIVPEDDSEALSLVYLSIGLSFVISCFLFILILIFGENIAALLKHPELRNLLYLVPCSTFLLGTVQSFNYWYNRKANYRIMASSRVLQSSIVSSTQLTSGFFRLSQIGLIFGQIVGQLISFIYLSIIFRLSTKSYKGSILNKNILTVARKYKRFPQFLILAHVFNTSSSQTPAVLLNTLFSSAASGYFMLTERVLQVPISLVSSAIGDVFRQEASYQYARTKECKKVYITTLKKLLLLSFMPFLLLFIFAEDVFIFAFGVEWAIAGEYAKILTPMFFMRFIVSPLSVMFMIAEVQRLDLIWQIMLFVLVIFSFFVGYYFKSLQVALIGFSSAYVIMFSLNLYWSYSLAKGIEHIDIFKRFGI